MSTLILVLALTAASPSPPRMALLSAEQPAEPFPVWCMPNGDTHELVLGLGTSEGSKKSFQEVGGDCHVDAAWMEQDRIFLALIEDVNTSALSLARGSTETGWQERPPLAVQEGNQRIVPAVTADRDGGWIAYGTSAGISIRRVSATEAGLEIGPPEAIEECADGVSVSLATVGGKLAVACSSPESSFRIGLGSEPGNLEWREPVSSRVGFDVHVVPVDDGIAVLYERRAWGLSEEAIEAGEPLGEGEEIHSSFNSVAAGLHTAMVHLQTGRHTVALVDRLGLVGARVNSGYIADHATLAEAGAKVFASWRTENGVETRSTGTRPALVTPDRDGDGVDDREDPCPTVADAAGCPEDMPSVADLLASLSSTSAPAIVTPGATGGRLLPTRSDWFWLTDHGGLYQWEPNTGWIHKRDLPRGALVRATSDGDGLWIAGHNGLVFSLEGELLFPKWRALPMSELQDFTVESYRGDGLAWLLADGVVWLRETESGRSKNGWTQRMSGARGIAGSRHGCHVLTESKTAKLDQVNKSSPSADPPEEIGRLDRVVYSREWGLFCSSVGAVTIGNHSSGFYRMATVADADLREGSRVSWPGSARTTASHIVDIGNGSAASVDESERTVHFWRAPDAIRPWTSQLLPVTGLQPWGLLVVLNGADGGVIAPIGMPGELVFAESNLGVEPGLQSGSLWAWLVALSQTKSDSFDSRLESLFTEDAKFSAEGVDVQVLADLRYLDAFDREPDGRLIATLDGLRGLRSGDAVIRSIEGGYSLQAGGASVDVVDESVTFHKDAEQCEIVLLDGRVSALNCQFETPATEESPADPE